MSDKYFVDTNILMYAHDSAAGEKHARAKALVEELWESRSGVVSTQVLQELAVNLRRKVKKPLDAKGTRWARIGRHTTLLATLSHPSAQGHYNWADLSRPYLHDTVRGKYSKEKEVVGIRRPRCDSSSRPTVAVKPTTTGERTD